MAETQESPPRTSNGRFAKKSAFWLEEDGEDRGSRLRATRCVVGSV